MNNGLLTDSQPTAKTLSMSGDRWMTGHYHTLVAALAITSLSLAVGCAGAKAVRPTVVDQPAAISQITSQQQNQNQQQAATPTGLSDSGSQGPNLQAPSQQIPRLQETGQRPSEHQPYMPPKHSGSPQYQAILGQAAYQPAPQVAPPVALVSYQQQQAIQPIQQSSQSQTPQATGMHSGRPTGVQSSQATRLQSSQAASLGLPRHLQGNHSFEPSVEAPVSMPRQSGQAYSLGQPVQPNQINQQYPQQVTSQMGDVVNLHGARFRPSPKTATEIMLEFKADNDRMRQEIALGKQARANLKDQLDLQRKLNQKTELKLSKSRDQAARLREMVAKLQVQVEHLVVEKDEIKTQSEAALSNIETNLDAVLMNSISRARQKPVSLN